MARIEIAVVGAHMTGMPLNGELLQRGGQFGRGGRTTSDYRLYALAGGPPSRPGLFRVADRAGSAIEVEVWTLEPAAFGDFVSNIPPPLGIGTVRLADGTSPKGFLVEQQGTLGARDISSFGGWRSYTASLAGAV